MNVAEDQQFPRQLASLSKSCQKQGLKCLEDAPRSGRPIVIDGKKRAKITALACSGAPNLDEARDTARRIIGVR